MFLERRRSTITQPRLGARLRDRIRPSCRAREAGDTLVEILIAVVVAGIVVSASLYSISLGATTSKSHRDFVTADGLLRDSAEATKQAVRSACATGTTYSVAFSALPSPVTSQTWHQYYETGLHFTLPADVTNQACPSSTQAPTVPLSVTLPDGTLKSMNIVVRKP